MPAELRIPMAVLAAAAAFALAVPPADAHGDEEHAEGAREAGAEAEAEGHEPADVRLMMPMMDSERGMRLFVSKGCIACHAVNGVGGHGAVALDAHTMEPVMNPFDLAAKMWRMAPYMIAAQQEALGYQITFTGAELADIVAFLHDDAQQHELSEDLLTAEVREMMDHEHAAPGGGAAAHAEELGHGHMDEGGGHMDEDDGHHD